MSIAIALEVKNQHVYIIGGGYIAERKIHQFIQEDALLHVIGKEILPSILKNSAVHCIQQAFSWELIEDSCFLMYIAIDDKKKAHEILSEAKQRNILCGCSIYDETSSFHSMVEERKSHLQVALSTNGTCPGVARPFLEALHPQLVSMNERAKILQQLRNHLPSKKDVGNLAKLSLDCLSALLDCLIYKKTIIVVAYHGFIDIDINKNPLHVFHEKMKAHFPKQLIIYGFLSNKILQKVKQRGYEIDDVLAICDALQTLQIRYVVQPILLNEGTWYKKLDKQPFIGKCILQNKEDAQAIYDLIKKDFLDQSCIFVYHDTKHSYFQQIKLRDQDQCISLSQFRELQNPTGTILPLFLFSSHHIWKEMLTKNVIISTYYDGCLLNIKELQHKLIKKVEILLENV